MIQNKRGRGPGLALVLILIVALAVAFLAVRQMGTLGFGGAAGPESARQNAVQQAQDVVDQINGRIQQAAPIP